MPKSKISIEDKTELIQSISLMTSTNLNFILNTFEISKSIKTLIVASIKNMEAIQNHSLTILNYINSKKDD